MILSCSSTGPESPPLLWVTHYFSNAVNGEVAKFNVDSFQIDYPEHDVTRPWPQRQIMSHKYFLEVGSHAVGQDRARRGKAPSMNDVTNIFGGVLIPLSAFATAL